MFFTLTSKLNSLRTSALSAFLVAAAGAHAIGLHGIATSFSGFTFLKINPTTAACTPLATLNLPGVATINALTYDAYHRQYVAVANVSGNSAYLITIDPITFQTSAPVTGITTGYMEGVEYCANLGGLVVSYGNNYYTKNLGLLDVGYDLAASSTFYETDFDMDTVFQDKYLQVNILDTNNHIDEYDRHWVINPFNNPVRQGFNGSYGATDYDVARHPGLERLYVTRGTSLGYVNDPNPGVIPVGGYGGYDVRAIAYGPDSQNIIGNLVLDDTSAFGQSLFRNISYTVKLGATPISVGSIFALSPITPFSVTIPDDLSGNATIEFDGSSFLRKTTTFTIMGSTTPLGNVFLQNGDPDFSGEVDAVDIDLVIARFGNVYPSSSPDPDADVDVSGEVDAVDIDIVVANFGGVDN